MDQFEEDEESLVVQFQNGYWEWDEKLNRLVFVSEASDIEVEEIVPKVVDFSALQFNEDIDLNEQQRFRKRFQGKPSSNDVVTLQNVIDVVLFTAPKVLLNETVLRMICLTSMEQFLRALILYCQYYLQIEEEMNTRTIEGYSKIRTVMSDTIEAQFQNDLEDLRILIMKDYSMLVTGEGQFKKFHHMSATKQERSMTQKDKTVFESVLRLAMQIVWIALGRKSYKQIEIELHRIFKSDIFNFADRNNKHLIRSLVPVLKGRCIPLSKKILTCSPLINGLFCDREVDFQMYGLGVLHFDRLNTRLRYLEDLLTVPEAKIVESNLSIGILGLPRANFDIMLKPIEAKLNPTTASSNVMGKRMSSVKSKSSYRKSTVGTGRPPPLYKPIILPPRSQITKSLPEFPTNFLPSRRLKKSNLKLWLQVISKRDKKDIKPKPGSK